MSVTQWVVELSNGTDDPDYYGPFPDIGAARAWRNDREWARVRLHRRVSTGCGGRRLQPDHPANSMRLTHMETERALAPFPFVDPERRASVKARMAPQCHPPRPSCHRAAPRLRHATLGPDEHLDLLATVR